MNTGGVVASHFLLAPLLMLSQPPWSGLFMLLVRVGVTVLFLLVLWVLLMLWWRRRRTGENAPRYLRDWIIPLLLAGLGLLLLCSQDRGSVDHLFQQVDSFLMSDRLLDVTPDVAPASWYDVLRIPEDDEGYGEVGVDPGLHQGTDPLMEEQE